MPHALTTGRRKRRPTDEHCRDGDCAHYHEMMRLRRNLHDGLGPGLAGIMIRADLLAQSLDGDELAAQRLLGDLRREAAAFMSEFRRVLANQEPAELDGAGLTTGLTTLADRMRAASGDRLTVTVDADPAVSTVDHTTQVTAFWIAREALTNVVKHANATQATVHVTVDGGIQLSIVDNGSGGVGAAGVGLTSMRGRAAELGGWCEVADTGGGVTVTAHLPEGWAHDDRAA